jgi:GAF domain-containing protein
MSAVLKPEQSSEQAFFDSQMLPPEKRGVSFEALFYRQLQQVTTKIHETENIDQIMLEASQDICKLFNADRLTLYAINEDRSDRPEHKPRPEVADQRAEHRRVRSVQQADAEHLRRLRRRGAQAHPSHLELSQGS